MHLIERLVIGLHSVAAMPDRARIRNRVRHHINMVMTVRVCQHTQLQATNTNADNRRWTPDGNRPMTGNCRSAAGDRRPTTGDTRSGELWQAAD